MEDHKNNAASVVASAPLPVSAAAAVEKRNRASPPFLVALQAGSASAADWAGLQGALLVGRSLLACLSTYGYTELLPFQHLIFNPHSGRRAGRMYYRIHRSTGTFELG